MLTATDAPPESLARYILAEPQAIALAIEWFPQTFIGVIARLVIEAPQPLTGVPYDALAEAAAVTRATAVAAKSNSHCQNLQSSK